MLKTIVYRVGLYPFRQVCCALEKLVYRVSGFFFVIYLAGKRLSDWTFAFARMPRGIAKFGEANKLDM